MDDATIRDFIATISEQTLILDRNLANLRAAVIVLQAIAALQMAPDDPLKAAKQLQNLEKEAEAARCGGGHGTKERRYTLPSTATVRGLSRT